MPYKPAVERFVASNTIPMPGGPGTIPGPERLMSAARGGKESVLGDGNYDPALNTGLTKRHGQAESDYYGDGSRGATSLYLFARGRSTDTGH